MKKIIILFFLAILIGVGLGIYSYKKFYEEDSMKVFNTSKDVYAIQIGVFDNIDNAKKMATSSNGIVVLDDNKYRVYIAIVNDSLDIIKNYYNEKNIKYYIKTINVGGEFYNTLNDYELLLKSSSKDMYDDIMKNILKEYDNLES